MGVSSLARVLTGWTGTIVYDDGTAVTVTPYTRESVASLLLRLVNDVLVATGKALTVSVSAAGLVTLTGTVAFDLTLAGNCDARTGFTGSYTGAATYTAATSFSGAYVPAYGLRLGDPMLATARGPYVGDGSAGVAPVSVSAASRLVVWDDEISLPDLSYEYDVWRDGRVFARVLAKSIMRVPMSTIRTIDTTRIDIDVQEVA